MSNRIPQTVATAQRLHEAYLRQVNAYQRFCSRKGDELLLWNYVDRTIRAGDEASPGDSTLRDAIGLPGDDSFVGVLASWGGVDNVHDLDDLIEGNLTLNEKYSLWMENYDGTGVPSNDYLDFGREILKKREKVEEAAKNLYDHLTSDDFRDGFARLDYNEQVTYAAEFTTDLDASQYGIHMLRLMLIPRDFDGGIDVDVRSSLDEPIFPALQLVDPYEATGNVVNIPEDASQQKLVVDGPGYTILDPELGSKLGILVANLMAGVVAGQADDYQELTKFQLQRLFSTFATHFEEQELIDLVEDHEISFEDFLDQTGTFFGQIENLAEAYKQDLTASFDASDEIIETFASNVGTVLTVGSVGITMVGTLNQDDVEFSLEGSLEMLDAIGDIADIADSLDGANNTGFGTIEFDERNSRGRIRKTTPPVQQMTGRTFMLSAGKKLCTLVDVAQMAKLIKESAEDGDWNLLLLGSVNVGLIVAGAVAGGVVGFLIGLTSVGVGLLISSLSVSDFEEWMLHCEFGVEEVSTADNRDPSSQLFGYDGYRKELTRGTMSGLSRQISGYYNHTNGFSFVTPAFSSSIDVVETSSGERSLTIKLEDILGATSRTSFYVRVVEYDDAVGQYEVSRLLYRIPAIMWMSGSWHHYTNYPMTNARNGAKVYANMVTSGTTFEAGGNYPASAGDALTEWQVMIRSDEGIPGLFGIDPNSVSTEHPPYLEVMMAPSNLKGEIENDLRRTGSRSSEGMVDTVLDFQPQPRKRIEMEFDT
ncbi:hypothetical protein ACLI4U_00595 [Natrialbaceae archaeon A-CW2]|uniref:hypothetical protein n=1 Tax=Natronosalvus amylolyticus TaxID=2961994 RepID=UPI0020C9998E|nr:hypothetical protein [Natronosalvus amylolyticus]